MGRREHFRRGMVVGVAFALALGTLAAGAVVLPSPASAAYCDDFPFLCVTYTVVLGGTGSGTVTSTDGTINCRQVNGSPPSGSCQHRYVKGPSGSVSLELTGTADPGNYVCWESSCANDVRGPVPFTFSTNFGSNWTFQPETCSLVSDSWCVTVGFQLTGTGGATVDTADGLIHCARSGGITTGTCSHEYFIGPPPAFATVSYTMTASPGSLYCSGGTCTTALNANHSTNGDSVISFEVNLVDYTISVLPNGGIGYGTITSDLGGINCGPICYATFHYGDAVRLTATPDSTSRFSSWDGSCAGQDATCDFTVTSDQLIRATFNKIGSSPPPGATTVPGATPGTSALGSSLPGSTNPTNSSPAEASPGGSTVGGSPAAGSAGPDSSPTVDPSGAATTSPDLTGVILAILLAGLMIAGGLAFGLRYRRRPPEAPPVE